MRGKSMQRRSRVDRPQCRPELGLEPVCGLPENQGRGAIDRSAQEIFMTYASHPAHRRAVVVAVLAVGLGMSLAGCQKTTTTTETPSGSTSTTTYSTPTMPALSASASAMASNAMSGASQTLGKVEERLDNGALTAKVKTALFAAADVKALQIDVDSKDGVVTLNGTQETALAVDRAAAVARGTEGVASVENRLTVKLP
ncbi:MAG: BON domain-containing protein [Rubrivivax sp.]